VPLCTRSRSVFLSSGSELVVGVLEHHVSLFLEERRYNSTHSNFWYYYWITWCLVFCMLQDIGGTLDSGQRSVLDGVPRNRAPGTHYVGGRVDLRAGVNDTEKGRTCCTSAGNQTLVIQCIACSL
jgi:hypothetical protein